MSTLQPPQSSKGSAKPRIRHYRRVLTSALHRRFAHASGLALLVCWDTSFWVGAKNSYFWSWFPISLTGVRAVLLFVSCLAIFILRVATLQLGRRVSSSPWETVRRSLFSLNTIQTIFWYLFSAYWFSEVCIFLSPRSHNLSWIVRRDVSNPDRLNERPIYLRSVFLLLALCQSALHIYHDYSSIHLPVSAPTKNPSPDNRTHKLPAVTVQLKKAALRVLRRSGAVTALATLTGLIIYPIFLRQIFWSWHVTFAKVIYSLPRSDARPHGYPSDIPGLMLQSAILGFFLVLTWESTSLLFSTLLAQEPRKKGQLLSTGSRDPNGTLISGLRAKRDVVKHFAFWELVIIAQQDPERRKVIFNDIEREGGPAWTQMLHSALDVLHGITSRIEEGDQKPKRVEEKAGVDAMEIDSLPRIAPPVKKMPIYAASPPPRTRTEEIESLIDQGARRIGQSKNPYSPSVREMKGLLKYVTPAGVSADGITWSSARKWASSAVQTSHAGWFFRTTFERQVNKVILGSPRSNAAVIVDAIEATTRMLVVSLSEDNYGKVFSGVPATVRTFTSTIIAIERFVQDVKEQADEDSDIEEVEVILARLKGSLAELLSAFQLYLTEEGLSAVEHRQAQNASMAGRLLPELERRTRVEKRLQLTQDDGAGREKGKGKEGQREVKEQRQNETVGAKAKAKANHGERRPQQMQRRLEPQDPAKKKLFQDAVPKKAGRREMEQVR